MSYTEITLSGGEIVSLSNSIYDRLSQKYSHDQIRQMIERNEAQISRITGVAA